MTTQATGRGRSDGPKRDIVFHSALADRGPVRITVDSEPRFLPKRGRHVVEITIGSDALLYWCENEQCMMFFNGQKGRTFTVIAEGSKEQATITYVGEAVQPGATSAPPAPVLPPQRPAPPVTAPARAVVPPNGKPDWVDRFLDAQKHAGRLGVALRLAGGQCLSAATAFCEANGVPMENKTKTAMVSNIAEAMCQRETMISMLIAMDRAGTVGCLPPVLSEDVQRQARERVEARKAQKATPVAQPTPPTAAPVTEAGAEEEDDIPF